jgi:16S rRNA (adenine1518-N6/adenine1519-N6)-dimethyltransferase
VTFSRLASPGATIEVLRRHGLYTKKSLGQHFLVDDNIIGRILELAAVSSDDVVLEVGPGIGTLTVALCDRARGVVAVEADPRLVPVLDDTTAECACPVTVVLADAVTVDPADLVGASGAPTLLVANLPYGVAATVVLRLFETMESLTAATVMVQAEVADRMAAEPGRKDYGAYTVKLRMYAEPSGSFSVPRTCFMPPPRVDSRVLRLERAVHPSDADVRSATARLVEAAIAQRRKTLRNSVLASTGWSGALFDEALSETGVDGRRRAETLGVDEFVALASAAARRGLHG